MARGRRNLCLPTSDIDKLPPYNCQALGPEVPLPVLASYHGASQPGLYKGVNTPAILFNPILPRDRLVHSLQQYVRSL
ncbi:uncharacterized protein EKO05_0006635 [Ascochyta rabiei]|uniref:uncharacterized protein n=1 Tax=Didymella rabiei TaxID=5454 RepID=UPI00220A81B7|nr:uncharacterized protein EKO05_0006635 [Ascochyta rabiei]UPX16224.1 hypothetical protein EKO05_0006635 [Ascochyta rabiei]